MKIEVEKEDFGKNAYCRLKFTDNDGLIFEFCGLDGQLLDLFLKAKLEAEIVSFICSRSKSMTFEIKIEGNRI